MREIKFRAWEIPKDRMNTEMTWGDIAKIYLIGTAVAIGYPFAIWGLLEWLM